MTGKGELSIFGNGKAAADFAVEKWVGACTDSIENKGYFTTALSGGKTPIDFYKYFQPVVKNCHGRRFISFWQTSGLCQPLTRRAITGWCGNVY